MSRGYTTDGAEIPTGPPDRITMPPGVLPKDRVARRPFIELGCRLAEPVMHPVAPTSLRPHTDGVTIY
jgi:hypothetical protein